MTLVDGQQRHHMHIVLERPLRKASVHRVWRGPKKWRVIEVASIISTCQTHHLLEVEMGRRVVVRGERKREAEQRRQGRPSICCPKLRRGLAFFFIITICVFYDLDDSEKSRVVCGVLEELLREENCVLNVVKMSYNIDIELWASYILLLLELFESVGSFYRLIKKNPVSILTFLGNDDVL